MRGHHMKHRIWIATLLMLAFLTACSAVRQSTPTPTPLATVVGARLGGPNGAFDTTYTHVNGSYEGTIAGQSVTFGTVVATGTDGAGRVIEIVVFDMSDPWDTKTAAKVVATFLPPDAIHLRDVHGQFEVRNYFHVYRSKLLAASLNASAFGDIVVHTTPIPPGTLSWICTPLDLTATVFNSCTISVRAPKA